MVVADSETLEALATISSVYHQVTRSGDRQKAPRKWMGAIDSYVDISIGYVPAKGSRIYFLFEEGTKEQFALKLE